jgi:hypothetical protein
MAARAAGRIRLRRSGACDLAPGSAAGVQDLICWLWIRRASTARSISGVAVPAARARGEVGH